MKQKMLSLWILCALLAGCAVPGAGPTPGYTFTDDLGRRVTVDNPQRVAPLLGSFAQIWMLAGGSVRATADDAWEDLDLDLGPDTVNLGNTKHISLELLLSVEPDFVLASTGTRQNLEFRETLENAGIPVAYFDVSDFDDYLRVLELCTNITGRRDLYQKHGLEVLDQVEGTRDRAAKRGTHPTVLCMRASASTMTVKNSEDNVLGEMLASLGCINIADSDTSLLENLSLERILAADPDYIFIVQRGDDEQGMRALVASLLEQQPAWQQLTAVKEGRVYFMDKTLYNLKPNHRWGLAYEQLEGILGHG